MTRQRTFTGRSGQMAVVAELLFRQCNAAIPELDYGTDLFAFRDDREEIARVQVKAAQGKRYLRDPGFSAQFSIPLKQLRHLDRPPLYYVLAVRVDGLWTDYLVLGRTDLQMHWNGDRQFGTENRKSGDLVLSTQFRPQTVLCGQVDLTSYRSAWELLPPLQPGTPERAAKVSAGNQATPATDVPPH